LYRILYRIKFQYVPIFIGNVTVYRIYPPQGMGLPSRNLNLNLNLNPNATREQMGVKPRAENLRYRSGRHFSP
jgi:hypothetical protein